MRLLRFVSLAMLCLGIAGGCRGRKKEPQVWLTYQVDVDAAYDARSRSAEAITKAARDTIAQRLELVFGNDVSVVTRGNEIVIALPRLNAAELREVQSFVQESGRIEIQRVDEHANVFANVAKTDLLEDEGISVSTEQAPDGLGPDGLPKFVTSTYASIRRAPRKYPDETMEECRVRFERWTRTLRVPDDRQIAFEPSEDVDAAPSTRMERGWRTLYLVRPAEMTNDDVADIRTLKMTTDSVDRYLVELTLTADAAARFEALTAANVKRRLALVLDGKVNSAPIVNTRVAGGRVSLNMGEGPPEEQLSRARHIESSIRKGAMPAPLRLLNVESATGK